MANIPATTPPTQRPLDDAELRDLLEPLGSIASHRLLSGGTFSAVHGVHLTDGTRVVVKTSVPASSMSDGRTPLLTYERDMLHSEQAMLRMVEGVEGVPSPRVLLSDFSHATRDVDALVMTWLDGTPWDTVANAMTPQATARAHAQVGEVMSATQSIVGDTFGFPAADFALGSGQWVDFFSLAIDSIIADAQMWGVDIEADRLLEAVAKGADALAEVTEPRFIHHDLWMGNVLLNPASGDVCGIVDFERSLFGDPLCAFVGAETMRTGASTPALLAGYESAGGRLPRDPAAGTATGFSKAADQRTTLYRLWLGAIQCVEIVPRQFHGKWLEEHRARLVANREVLLERAGV